MAEQLSAQGAGGHQSRPIPFAGRSVRAQLLPVWPPPRLRQHGLQHELQRAGAKKPGAGGLSATGTGLGERRARGDHATEPAAISGGAVWRAARRFGGGQHRSAQRAARIGTSVERFRRQSHRDSCQFGAGLGRRDRQHSNRDHPCDRNWRSFTVLESEGRQSVDRAHQE